MRILRVEKIFLKTFKIVVLGKIIVDVKNRPIKFIPKHKSDLSMTMLRVVRGSLSSIISILTVPSCVELLYLREFQFLKFIYLSMWFVTYM